MSCIHVNPFGDSKNTVCCHFYLLLQRFQGDLVGGVTSYWVVMAAPLANDRAKAVRFGFAFVSYRCEVGITFSNEWRRKRKGWWRKKSKKILIKSTISFEWKFFDSQYLMLALYKPSVESSCHSLYLMAMCYVRKTALNHSARDPHSTFHWFHYLDH